MHVVEVIYMWPPETFIDRHAVAILDKSNIRLTLATANWLSDNSSTRQDIGVRAYAEAHLPEYKRFSRLHKGRVVIANTLRMDAFSHLPMEQRVFARALAALKPDLVHFHFEKLAVRWAWCTDLLGIPYTVSIRNLSEVKFWSHDYPEDSAQLIKVLENAAAIHTVCDTHGKFVREMSPKIPEPQTIRTLIPQYECVLARPTTTTLKFVSAGRLTWTKGFNDLIRAMVYLPGASLDIVGEGRDREYLQYLILMLNLQSRVRLLGSLAYEVWTQSLESATAFVQSSLSEGFSNALAEAMSLTMPVFVTNVGGTCELVHDGTNGIIIPFGDPVGIAEKLRMAANPTLMAQIGQAAWQTAQESFAAAAHVERFRLFFETAIRGYGE